MLNLGRMVYFLGDEDNSEKEKEQMKGQVQLAFKLSAGLAQEYVSTLQDVGKFSREEAMQILCATVIREDKIL